MPKVKTHTGAKKRFRVTANGRVKRAQQGKNHILTKKNRKSIRNLRQGAYVDETQEATIKKLIPYQ